jgi:hypothetical protein
VDLLIDRSFTSRHYGASLGEDKMMETLKGLLKLVVGAGVVAALIKAFQLYQAPATVNAGIALGIGALIFGYFLVTSLEGVSWNSLSGGGSGFADPEGARRLKEQLLDELVKQPAYIGALTKNVKRINADDLSRDDFNSYQSILNQMVAIRHLGEDLMDPDE